jgi:hypothetical protein
MSTRHTHVHWERSSPVPDCSPLSSIHKRRPHSPYSQWPAQPTPLFLTLERKISRKFEISSISAFLVNKVSLLICTSNVLCCYSFFSAAHGTFYKIDYILGHKASLKKYKKIEITPCILIIME